MDELLKNEKALISVLKEVDDSFLRDLFSCRCLSLEELKGILSLDDKVDSGLKARYIWLTVYSHFRRNKELPENFILLLCQCKLSSKLGLFFKIKTSDISEIMVFKDHVPLLTEGLVQCNYKWEEIGIGLGLSQHVIEECRSSGSNNTTKLHKILVSWQEKNGSKATLKVLTDVLRKDLIGMVSLANKLKVNIEDRIISTIPELDQQFVSQIVMQSNVEVLDGKSTLLCAHAPEKLNKRVRYQWMKGKKPLNNDRHYSGVRNSILLIKCACQGLEGEYTCSVEVCHTIKEKLVNLNISYYSIKEHLMKRYMKEKEVPKDSWPPVGISDFINLALISEGIYTKLDYSVRGDMDDILKLKEIYKFEELFSAYKSGALVLLEGRPGSGKTTLTHKIVKEWAKGPDVLYGAKFVFLISLRILNSTKKDQNLSEILSIFYNVEHVELLVNHLEKYYGEGACFIIDGLDEYKSEDSVVIRLIKKEYLPNAMIVVASRPVATVQLRYSDHTDRRIEVLGFSRDQISTYINQYDFKGDRTALELKAYLKSHINVLHMCYLPVHVAMVCFIYNECEKIPNTETKIYEIFTLLTINRMLRRDGKVHIMPSTLKCLHPKIRTLLNNVCKLPFDMTSNSQQSIHQDKTTIFSLSDENGCDAHSLGLVTVDSTASLFNFTEIYSFLHLTFQEFLAASYLADQDYEKQMDIIKKHSNKRDILVVWKFFCGIMKFSDSHSELIHLILNSKSMTDVYKIHCAFESQQPIVCSIFMAATETLTFEDYEFSPTDFNAIGYVTSHAPYAKKLILKNCVLSESGLKFASFSNINYLSFSTKGAKSQLIIFNVLLQQCGSLETLDLVDHEFLTDDILTITDGVTLPCLKVLKLRLPLADKSDMSKLKFNSSKLEQVQYYTNSHASHKKFLSDLLAVFKCKIVPLCEFPPNILCNLQFNIIKVTKFLELSSVILINSDIDDNGVQYLLSNSHYETVRLDINRITDTGAKHIADLMRKCNKLKHLSVSCNMISDKGALAIVHEVHSTPDLIELDLQGNNVSREGGFIITCALKRFSEVQCKLTTMVEEKSQHIWDAITMEGPYQSVTRAFQSFKYLNILNLGGHDSSELLFGCDVLSAIGKGLKSCNLLEVLILSNNKIRGGMFELAKGLDYCHKLKVLDLHNNCIESYGAKALGDWLKNWWQKSLMEFLKLNLSNNCIGESGAVDLACGLKYCHYLESLDLSHNSITEKGANAIVAALENRATLLEFKFSYNEFSDPLKGCVKLQTLCLESTHISSLTANEIFRELKCCVNLQSLNVSDNVIVLLARQALAEALNGWKHLKFLKIGNNFFGTFEKTLYRSFGKCTELIELHIEHNGFLNKELLLEALSNCLCLQKLILDGNKFNKTEVESLILLINNNKSIEQVSLKHTAMDSASEQSLLAGLTSCSTLQLLTLCTCDIKNFQFETKQVNNCKINIYQSSECSILKKARATRQRISKKWHW